LPGSHLRWTIRFWSRNRATTALLLLVLAFGIGSATAVFSVVSGVLLRPLPFAAEDELVAVGERRAASGAATRTSGITFREWSGASDVLAGLSAFTEGSLDHVGPQGPVRIDAASVEGSFFGVLGVRLALGRPLAPSDDVPGAAPVAVIGYDLWRSVFGADSGIIGRAVRFGSRSVEIVGVAPPEFDYPGGVAAWTPLFGPPEAESWASIRGARFLSVVGRLREGVTPRAAETRLAAIMRAEPELEGWEASVSPLRETLVAGVRTPLRILLASVLVLLLIACVNVSTVLFSQTRGRLRELAIRRALGARDRRLAWQLLVESLAIVTAGGALGVTLGVWGIDVLIALSPRELPETARLSLDGRVLGFVLLITLATAFGASIGPFFQMRRVRATAALAHGRPGAAGDRRDRRLWNGLVVVEVALTVLLLVGAGLLVRSFAALTAVDDGLDADRVTTFHIGLPDYRYGTPASAAAFQTALLERAEDLPGVESAALARNLPLSGSSMTSPVEVEDAAADGPTSTQFTTVTPGYFRTLGIGLVAGRAFLPSDDADGEPVAIVSESFARAFFAGRSPIGERARTMFGPPVMREIVGVVEDVRHSGPRVDAPPLFYAPQSQMGTPSFFLIVRDSAAPAIVVDAMRAAVAELDPELPLANVARMRDLLAESVAEPRFYASVLSWFGLLALVLATVGLFGLLVQRALARRREIGIRMALGARGVDAIGLIVRQGLVLVGAGTALGLLGALAASRFVSGLLYGVAPTDPATYGGVAGILLISGAVASWAPARRAASVDPVTAMRD